MKPSFIHKLFMKQHSYSLKMFTFCHFRTTKFHVFFHSTHLPFGVFIMKCCVVGLLLFFLPHIAFDCWTKQFKFWSNLTRAPYSTYLFPLKCTNMIFFCHFNARFEECASNSCASSTWAVNFCSSSKLTMAAFLVIAVFRHAQHSRWMMFKINTLVAKFFR